jgi:glycosyltransferase involved in cell wall biosynthesis
LFHATSSDEVLSIRRLGLTQPVAIIPNGVDVPDFRALPGRETLEGRFPELKGKRWLVFLSRIHPKKGIGDLLEVWPEIAGKFAGKG